LAAQSCEFFEQSGVALLSTSQLPLVWRRCPPAQHCR